MKFVGKDFAKALIQNSTVNESGPLLHFSELVLDANQFDLCHMHVRNTLTDFELDYHCDWVIIDTSNGHNIIGVVHCTFAEAIGAAISIDVVHQALDAKNYDSIEFLLEIVPIRDSHRTAAYWELPERLMLLDEFAASATESEAVDGLEYFNVQGYSIYANDDGEFVLNEDSVPANLRVFEKQSSAIYAAYLLYLEGAALEHHEVEELWPRVKS